MAARSNFKTIMAGLVVAASSVGFNSALAQDSKPNDPIVIPQVGRTILPIKNGVVFKFNDNTGESFKNFVDKYFANKGGFTKSEQDAAKSRKDQLKKAIDVIANPNFFSAERDVGTHYIISNEHPNVAKGGSLNFNDLRTVDAKDFEANLLNYGDAVRVLLAFVTEIQKAPVSKHGPDPKDLIKSVKVVVLDGQSEFLPKDGRVMITGIKTDVGFEDGLKQAQALVARTLVQFAPERYRIRERPKADEPKKPDGDKDKKDGGGKTVPPRERSPGGGR